MMNYFVNPVTSDLYGYDDEQVAAQFVADGLIPCAARPSQDHSWNAVVGDWQYVAPTPVAPISVTPLEYIERFTEAEQLAVVTAAMSSAPLRLWYDKLMAAQEVVFTDPRLSGGLDALVAAGLITAERKVELLTP